MNNWKKKLRPLFLDWSSEHTTECQRKHREDIERSDLRFQSTNESFEVFLKNVEGYIEKVIKEEREKMSERLKEEININQKGQFEDDAGNICWYLDDLNKKIKDL